MVSRIYMYAKMNPVTPGAGRQKEEETTAPTTPPPLSGKKMAKGNQNCICEAAAIKSGLPLCVREPEAALWWL